MDFPYEVGNKLKVVDELNCWASSCCSKCPFDNVKIGDIITISKIGEKGNSNSWVGEYVSFAGKVNETEYGFSYSNKTKNCYELIKDKPMKKVRYADKDAVKFDCLTMGKIYEVLKEDEDEYEIIDDDGDRDYFGKEYFELVEEEKIMKMEDFKPGMKVKVVRKIPSYQNGWKNTWINNMDKRVNDEKIYTVNVVNENGVHFEGVGEGFSWEALEIVEEEKIMKYKLLKSISGKSLFEANACKTEFDKFVKKYGFYEDVSFTEEFIEDAIKQNGWISFFVNNGFIEKVKPEVFYKIGDRFENKETISGGREWMICRIDSKYAFVSLKDGVSWATGIEVKSPNKITQGEFDKMCSSQKGNFTKIN